MIVRNTTFSGKKPTQVKTLHRRGASGGVQQLYQSGHGHAQWTPDRGEVRSGYWPVSVNSDTLFSVNVFSTFKEMKTVEPSLSREGFLQMSCRTCHIGRVRSVWIKVACSRDR